MITRYHHHAANLAVEGFVLHEPGDMIPGHDHTYSHLLRVMQGTSAIQIGDIEHIVSGTIDRPGVKEIPPREWHGAVAREPMTIVECVHVLRDEDGMPLGYDASEEQRFQAERRITDWL